jgi:hypothetical protein
MALEVEVEVPLRAIAKCYPSNMWYESDGGDGGGTAWQGNGFWKLNEMRSSVAR